MIQIIPSGSDRGFKWRLGSNGDMVVESVGPLPWHHVQWVGPAFDRLFPANTVTISATSSGCLSFRLPAEFAYWFAPALIDDTGSMVWESFRYALKSINAVHWAQGSRKLVHAGIDLRSMLVDGKVVGHYLEHISAYLVDPKPGIGLLIGDPRFAAPELFCGEYPTVASDIYAAAAVYCARNSTQDIRNRLPGDRSESYATLPLHRVDAMIQNADGLQKSLLLSLMDDDPQVRERVSKRIVADDPKLRELRPKNLRRADEGIDLGKSAVFRAGY